MKNTTKNKLVKTIACITTCFLCLIPQTVYAETDYITENNVSQAIKQKHTQIFYDLMRQNQIVFNEPNDCEFKPCSIQQKRENDNFRLWITGISDLSGIDANKGFVIATMDMWLADVALEGEKPYTWQYLEDQYSEVLLGTQISSSYYKAYLDYQNWLVYKYQLASNRTNNVIYIQGEYISFVAYRLPGINNTQYSDYNEYNFSIDLVNKTASYNGIPNTVSGQGGSAIFVSSSIDVEIGDYLKVEFQYGNARDSNGAGTIGSFYVLPNRDFGVSSGEFYYGGYTLSDWRNDHKDTIIRTGSFNVYNSSNIYCNFGSTNSKTVEGNISNYTGPIRIVFTYEINPYVTHVYSYSGPYTGKLDINLDMGSNEEVSVPITTYNINNQEITNNQYIIINDDHSTTIYNIDNSIHENIVINDNSQEITVINELNDKLNDIEDDYLVKLNDNFNQVDLQQIEPSDEIKNGLGLVKHIMTKTIDTYTDSNIGILFILPLILAIILMVIK